MSLRRTPRTLDEIVAWVEERLRTLDGDVAIEPTNTRFLYDQKGDVLFAAARDDPRPLHLPPDRPGSAGTWVIAPSPADDIGVAWVFVPFASAGGGGGSGGGGGGGGPVGPYQLLAEKGAANGYAGLDAGALVDPDDLGTGAVGAGTKFLADDQTFQTISTAAYTTVEDEGTPLTQRSTLDFVGAGVSAADAGGKTVVTIPGSSGFSFASHAKYGLP